MQKTSPDWVTKLRSRAAKSWQWFKSARLRTKILTLIVLAVVSLLALSLGTYAYFVRDIGDRERLMNRRNTGIVLFDRHGEPFYRFGHVGSTEVLPLAQISDAFEQALLASEDENFYKHTGYSLRGMVMAMYTNVMSRDLKRYGGSTITQQLVKNTLLSNNKSFLRKYQEVSMAVAIERHYTKDEILEMYINSVYFGEGAFGIKQAAQEYFNKDANDLSYAESALLVGILPAPSQFSPISGDRAQAKEQQERVLRRMYQAGFITEAQKNEIAKEELVYATPEANEDHAQHFAMLVMDELEEKYGEETLIRGGYQVNTGLDLDWQKMAEQLVAERVKELQGQRVTNAAMVVIDPKTGEIRTLVGSVDWDNEAFGKIDMTTALRQLGSSFKPIYYTEALDKKLITAATIMQDEPKTYGDEWRPQNYDFRFRGSISVRRALGQSLNIPSIDVMQKLGVEEAAAAAQRMGIDDINNPSKYGLSLALGTAEAKLLDMTNAYAAFANEGNQNPEVNIVSIKDKYGKTIFTHRGRPKRVQSAEASFLISSILSDNEARAPTFGASLNIPNRQVAVKTGTTDDYRDAWTFGYTPSLTVGVWVGNSDNQPMAGVAGSASAGTIWRSSMMKFLGDSQPEQFAQPANILKLAVCRSNGQRAERPSGATYDEFFIKGGEPTGKCNEQVKGREDTKQDDKKKEDEPEDEGGNDKPEGGRGRGRRD